MDVNFVGQPFSVAPSSAGASEARKAADGAENVSRTELEVAVKAAEKTTEPERSANRGQEVDITA